jgi:hypothetical protein
MKLGYTYKQDKGEGHSSEVCIAYNYFAGTYVTLSKLASLAI